MAALEAEGTAMVMAAAVSISIVKAGKGAGMISGRREWGWQRRGFEVADEGRI